MNNCSTQPAAPIQARTRRLREALARPGPLVLVGAHNALVARLVERAGFDGIWASSFEISATFGVPDANIITMSEYFEVLRSIASSVSIPVVADCDNGYGNAINVRRAVRECETMGLAGICIEDNVFPKRCSFYSGLRRELETPDEFCGKILAAKDAQTNPDFVIIARTEALISGMGLEEALRRANMYARAGADLVLAHSKAVSAAEAMSFAAAWDGPCQLVAIPTTYSPCRVEDLARSGFKIVIFANQLLRATIKALRGTLAELKECGLSSVIDDSICTLNEIYALTGVELLQNDEARFITAHIYPERTIRNGNSL